MKDGSSGKTMDLVSGIFEGQLGHPGGDVQQAVGWMGTMLGEK